VQTPAYQFSPYAIPSAVTAVAVIVFAIVIVWKRFSRTSVALFGASLAAAGWQISVVFMYLATETRQAQVWARLASAFAVFIAPAGYQFVASIVPVGTRGRLSSRIAWLIASQFAVLILVTDLILSGVHRYWWGFYPTFHPLSLALLLGFVVAVLVIAGVDIVRAYRTSKGREHNRIRLFAIALAIGCGALVNVLPLVGVPVFPLGWIALLGFIAVAINTLAKYGMIVITPSLAANEIIGTMRDLLLVSDRDGRIQFANNAACAFLGYAREDIIGTQLEDLLAPSDETQPPLQGKWVRDREYIFRTKLGQPIELTLSHSPVTHKGEVTGTVIIGRDLRERKRYEWEARRAVTLLQSTLDSTADGILVIGEDGRVLTWNQRFADMWGIPAELMEQDEDRDLVGLLAEQTTEPEEFRRGLENLRAHPEVESVAVLQLKDGRRLEQYSIGRYLDESPLRVWSFRDVTARLAAEEALRESETRYRSLFEENAAGVCVATTTGNIINCNSTFADMIGYETADLRNHELREFFDRVSAFDEIRRQLDETPTKQGLELELRRQDGQHVSALANISLLGQGDRALMHMTAVDISDRKRAEQQIEFQAYHDALTQLPNRRMFVERLELNLLGAKRSRGNVAVLFIDLDRFKTINDTLGHSVADQLLVEIAQRLRSCVRQTDTVARYGGDEFTIILPDLHQPEDAAQVAEKILERVSEPLAIGGTTIEISVSIGIAVYPYDGADIDTLLRNADDAMSRAKKAGRNGYQLWTEQMKARANERLSMQSRLRKAMDEGELVLAYQPQVSVTSGLIIGAEAELRLKDAERGIIEAAEFMPVAEETRLIVPLAEWALFSACHQLKQWRDSGMKPMRMSVRIPARQFQQRDLDRVVRRAIAETGIDPSLLELEIRETTAMRDVEISTEVMNHLRDLGVSIAIDDFGSGYSALGSLQVLPIHAVKIDPRFLASGTAGAGNEAIVGAVIDVGRKFGLRVAAGGVESREQFDFLQRRGCHEAQGQYFSHALDADSFRALVEDAKPLPAGKPAAIA